LGPERPTIGEQFIELFRLPYALGCAILALLGVTVIVLILPPFPSSQLSYGGPILYMLGVYSYYAPRYMRSRLLQMEKSMSPLLPKGETDFHEIFSSVSKRKPQLAFLLAIALVPFGSFLASPNFDIPVVMYPLVFGFSILLVVGNASAYWLYFISLLGIHKMGRLTIGFVPFYRDRTLGLRPVGSLAFSLAMSYFAFAGLILLLNLFAPNDPALWGFQASTLLFGVAMFFLPMRRLHHRMLEQKRLEREKLDRELEEAFARPGTDSPDDTRRILRLDIMKRELAATATWPYDVSILSKLTVISLSLTAILLSRIVAALLRI